MAITATSITPAVGSNLGGTAVIILGTGFGDGATHTLGKNDERSEKVFEINRLKHPVLITRNKEFEIQYLKKFAVKKINFGKIVRNILPLKANRRTC